MSKKKRYILCELNAKEKAEEQRKLYSYTSAEAEKLCLHSSSDTCRVCRVDVMGGKVGV